jgi:hypothetical protein
VNNYVFVAPRRKNKRFYLGELVQPSFSNESVYLFPRDPTHTMGVEDVIGEFGPPWHRGSTGIVLETRENGWMRLLVSSGNWGWIGDWNVDPVE